MWQAIAEQLSETLMFDFTIHEKVRLSGGDISESYMISDGEQRYFIKINQREFLPQFQVEADNIKALRDTSTVFVPELVHIGHCKHNSFLILNYLPTKNLDDSDNSYAFGQKLAELHLWGEQKEFGFDQDNYIGNTLQPNKWDKKWCRFFAEQRIGWQLQLASEKGIKLVDIDEFTQIVREQLASHQPRPSLLHGDLWYGNVANTPFGPICYDPACYWGDRECDLAMTELFGGFSQEFYRGYQSVNPLDAGYQQRMPIYNLYHVLNHYNLFGGHYLEQAESLIERVQAF
ncbi:fructosamine kinase family protein [Vibrio intestinalis]|uniref:fructosamine kinase family protein n=1 Tax=Vibrio intestinalis TaxID=2933291 RepID=UPI0021A2B25C|nr:fructosamine kinase family protein [Vibrio intestinalis]